MAARVRSANFALYLTIVGELAILFFIAGKPVLAGYSRYALLGILFPLGLTASLLALEPARFVRRSATALIVLWALLSARDHLAVAAAYSRAPEVSSSRMVAEQLVADGVHVARAGYWRAYVITFFSGERVHVASEELPRIQLYQDEFEERREPAIVISDYLCPDGQRIGELYICRQ